MSLFNVYRSVVKLDLTPELCSSWSERARVGTEWTQDFWLLLVELSLHVLHAKYIQSKYSILTLLTTFIIARTITSDLAEMDDEENVPKPAIKDVHAVNESTLCVSFTDNTKSHFNSLWVCFRSALKLTSSTFLLRSTLLLLYMFTMLVILTLRLGSVSWSASGPTLALSLLIHVASERWDIGAKPEVWELLHLLGVEGKYDKGWDA